ncbi:hypothetical protein PFICI_08636 [Pestalotiopsis fici W106-1]|uniref:Uncharacterized protein n=1 Tax=Pestalotiopsis fici (strain W106-1 / CGMCC3.15140) TaxID=1229662 RepID=W3WY46_PESFW|nr:uncharacterized protein PFICI_08636 [Pestalotiopsis fici W106-1]ETS78783.1 hypothetical protein PFICI_08636 [Pestalotiopsis fici W106-1]
MDQTDTFDPELCAKLHNEILEIGWEAAYHELGFEQAAPSTWWDRHGEECETSGVAARLTPQVIQFLKLAREIEPQLCNFETGYANFFYYISGLAPPSELLVDEAMFGSGIIRLYYVTGLESHPFGVILNQNTFRVQAVYSLTMHDEQTPWISLQSLLGGYLDMIRLGKITAGEEESDSDEKPQRPWVLHSHSEQVLDRTVEAFASLLKAIQDRMPSVESISDDIPAKAQAIDQAISLLFPTTRATFVFKLLRKIRDLVASASPHLRFIAPGIRILNSDDLMKQPYQKIDFHKSIYNNPILILPAEESDGTKAVTPRFDHYRNPFPRPYSNARSLYDCGLWISESRFDSAEFDDQCRLVLPQSATGSLDTDAVHYARSTDGVLLDSRDGPGFNTGLYQTKVNPFISRNHDVELFRVLENWVELVESGVWQVDENGVAGGIEKWREADRDEEKSLKYRIPLTW